MAFKMKRSPILRERPNPASIEMTAAQKKAYSNPPSRTTGMTTAQKEAYLKPKKSTAAKKPVTIKVKKKTSTKKRTKAGKITTKIANIFRRKGKKKNVNVKTLE
jgi:hypothetical protein